MESIYPTEIEFNWTYDLYKPLALSYVKMSNLIRKMVLTCSQYFQANEQLKLKRLTLSTKHELSERWSNFIVWLTITITNEGLVKFSYKKEKFSK